MPKPTTIKMVLQSFSTVAKEIYRMFNGLILFYGFLRFAVIFLFIFLVFSVFYIPWYYALIPAMLYFIYYIYSKSKVDKIAVVEEEYGDLNEKLSTAIDNPIDNNYFIASLHKEVRSLLKTVTSSVFFNFKRAITDLVTIGILSILIIVVAQFNFTIGRLDMGEEGLIDFSNVVDVLKEYTGQKKQGSSGEEGTGGEGEFDDIFGDKSVVELGNDEVEISINPAEYEIDISQEKPPEDLQFESIYPEEIGGEAAASYEEIIPRKQQEIVKQYYRNIAQTQ